MIVLFIQSPRTDMQEKGEYPPSPPHRQFSTSPLPRGFVQGFNALKIGSVTAGIPHGLNEKGGLRRLSFEGNGLLAGNYSE
jgi:hypothetical protein